MSVRVRLTRVGSKKNPIWRVVVADQRSPRDGRFIETIGHYNPQTEPSTIRIDEERLQHWLARGAQPSGTREAAREGVLEERRGRGGRGRAGRARSGRARAGCSPRPLPPTPKPPRPAPAEAEPEEG